MSDDARGAFEPGEGDGGSHLEDGREGGTEDAQWDIGPDRAVVDRIVGGQAVLLVGPEEHEAHVPATELPEAAGEGVWLVGDRADGEEPVRVRGLAPDLQARRETDLAARLRRLGRERRRGRFERGG